MASYSKMDVKSSPQKTHSAFNALPTLRGRDTKASEKSPTRKYKRPPQLADQVRFPGRRLDRPHRSTYSGYSGRSLDIETIISGGRLNSAEVNSISGSAKPKSLLNNGFSRSLNDVTNQPWDSVRQLPSAHSHLSLLSRQGNNNLFSAGGSSRPRGLVNTFPGASASTGNLNAPTQEQKTLGGYPVPSNRWQFSGNHKLGNQFQEKTIRDSTSPDSSYSSESQSEQEWPGPQIPVVTTIVPPPAIKLHKPTTNNASKKQNNYKTARRKSENTNQSSTPQLDKILWALVPDEFANISDTGVSELDPSIQETTSSHYLTFTDLEGVVQDNTGAKSVAIATSRVPQTPRRPTLTQELLTQFSSSVPNDDRILNWLADCEAHTLSSNLPTHLPDISYTFKFAHSKS